MAYVENKKLQLELSKEMKLEEFAVSKRLEAIESQINEYLDTGYKYYPPEEDIELINKHGYDSLVELLKDSSFRKKAQDTCL